MMKLVIKELWKSSPIEASLSPLLVLSSEVIKARQFEFLKIGEKSQNPQLRLRMDSLEVAEEIIDKFDNEISGQEALKFIAG